MKDGALQRIGDSLTQERTDALMPRTAFEIATTTHASCVCVCLCVCVCACVYALACTISILNPRHPHRYMMLYVSEGCRPANRLYIVDTQALTERTSDGLIDWRAYDVNTGMHRLPPL